MQPIDLTGVTSLILSTPYDKPLEVPVEVVKTIFNLGIDIRDKILALKKEESKPVEAMEDKIIEGDELYFLKDAKPYKNGNTFGKFQIAVMKNGNRYCIVEAVYPHEVMQNARDIIKSFQQVKELKEENKRLREAMSELIRIGELEDITFTDEPETKLFQFWVNKAKEALKQ